MALIEKSALDNEYSTAPANGRTPILRRLSYCGANARSSFSIPDAHAAYSRSPAGQVSQEGTLPISPAFLPKKYPEPHNQSNYQLSTYFAYSIPSKNSPHQVLFLLYITRYILSHATPAFFTRHYTAPAVFAYQCKPSGRTFAVRCMQSKDSASQHAAVKKQHTSRHNLLSCRCIQMTGNVRIAGLHGIKSCRRVLTAQTGSSSLSAAQTPLTVSALRSSPNS